MPLLTIAGLEKLQSLQVEIQTLADQDYKNSSFISEYSREMAKQTLQVIDYLQKNNSRINLGEIKNTASELKKPISVIDNQKRTGIPAIFNEQSFLIAKAFHDFIVKLDLRKDIDSFVNMGIKALSPANSIKRYLCEIKINIQIYSLLIQAKETHKKVCDLKAKIAARINYYYYQKAEKSIDIETLKKEHSEFISTMLHEINSISHFVLVKENVDDYYNTTKPYDIDPNNYMLRILHLNYMRN